MAKAVQPKVKQVIRYINKNNVFGPEGSQPVDAINEYLSGMYADGYELVDTHYIGDNQEGFGMLYVLHQPNG